MHGLQMKPHQQTSRLPSPSEARNKVWQFAEIALFKINGLAGGFPVRSGSFAV